MLTGGCVVVVVLQWSVQARGCREWRVFVLPSSTLAQQPARKTPHPVPECTSLIVPRTWQRFIYAIVCVCVRSPCVCPASRHRAALPSLRRGGRAAAAVGVGSLLSAASHRQLPSSAQHGEEVAGGRQGSPGVTGLLQPQSNGCLVLIIKSD